MTRARTLEDLVSAPQEDGNTKCQRQRQKRKIKLEPDQSIEIEPLGVLLPDEDDVEQPEDSDSSGAAEINPETRSDTTRNA